MTKPGYLCGNYNTPPNLSGNLNFSSLTLLASSHSELRRDFQAVNNQNSATLSMRIPMCLRKCPSFCHLVRRNPPTSLWLPLDPRSYRSGSFKIPPKFAVWSGDLRIVVRLVGKIEVFLRVALEDVVPGLEGSLYFDFSQHSPKARSSAKKICRKSVSVEKHLVQGTFPKSSRRFLVHILKPPRS